MASIGCQLFFGNHTQTVVHDIPRPVSVPWTGECNTASQDEETVMLAEPAAVNLRYRCVDLLTVMLLLLIWLTTTAEAGERFPRILVEFSPQATEPIFEGRGGNHWDAAIRERGWIHRHGNEWWFWYTGYDGTRDGLKQLGLAKSPDGLVWKRATEQPLYREHWVEDVSVILHEGTYYMVAEGYLDRAHSLTSTDGIHWQRRGLLDVRNTAGQPLPDGPLGTPTLFRDNDRWYLFYERRDLGVWLASSTDFTLWTNVQDDPVLQPGPAEFDRDLIALNQIFRHDGHYYAVYHGTAKDRQPPLWSTAIAVSDDLRHWEKFAKNPLLPREQNKSSGQIHWDGERFRLYTAHPKLHVHFGPKANQ